MRSTSLQLAVMALGIALFSSCGGGGGGSSPSVSPVPGPTNLTAAYSYGQFTFTWTPSAGPVDGYEFEGKSGGGAYQRLNETLLPSNATVAYLSGTVPELTTYAFRLRAKRGEEYSQFSNEAAGKTELNPPTISAYLNSYSGGISVSWYSYSQIADTLLLERGTTLDGGASYSWATIPGIAFGLTSYLDKDSNSESAGYAYRVTYSKGSDKVAATSSMVTIPMGAPSDLVATPLFEGVNLKWKTNTQKAEEIVVLRATGIDSYPSFQEVAHLPNTASSFDDLNLATGFYTYRVEARKTGASSASSNNVPVATLPPAGGIALTPQILAMPDSIAVARDSKGGWVLAGNSSYEPLIRTPNGDGWADYRPANASGWVSPYLLLDAQDRPHSVFLRATMQNSNERAIIHTWFDGTEWKTEEIARRSLSSNSASQSMTYALDVSGNLHLVWLKDGTWGSTSSLEYAFRSQDGTWKTESLDVVTPSITNLGGYRLILDPSGKPHVLLGAWQAMYHLMRGQDESWTWEEVPTGGASAGWYDFFEGQFLGSDRFVVYFVRSHSPYDGKYDLASISKNLTVWEGAQVLDSTLGGTSISARLATSPSGQRAAISYSGTQGNKLLSMDNGTWTSTTTGPSSYSAPFLGFDKNEKLFLLQRVGYSSGNSTPYVLYSEVP